MFELVKQHFTDEEIATDLAISVPEAGKHVNSVLAKLGYQSRQALWIAEGRKLLTPREWEVIEFVKQRWSNPEIARELGIAESTVETHVHNALEKLGYRTRREFWDDMKLGDRSG